MKTKGHILQTAKKNFSLIIFGASGSLAKLKLFPAIYELVQEGRMPKDYKIMGYSRTKMTDEQFRKHFAKSIREHVKYVEKKKLDSLLKNVFYFSGQYDEESDYKKMLKELKKVEKDTNRVRIAYFSVPPSAFQDIFKNLGTVNFNSRVCSLRLVIEKPFGYDHSSAKKLKKTLYKYFDEDQLFLLDHYLGKEAVSNLLSLRYANSVLTSLMHRDFVSNIQIYAMEDVDIEGRANYFNHVGIVRDMVQSHLLQILAYLTMYLPKEESADAIHHEKARVLKSIRIKNVKQDVVRGQYRGYTKEEGVPKDSQTETFAALKLKMSHPLWKDVPIYFRAGKALKEKWTAVVVEFKPRKAQRERGNIAPNRLVIQLQPFEKIEFFLLTKLGGKTFNFHELTTGRPIYCSGDCLSEHGRLFLDVIAGKQGLFLNFDEILAAWNVIDPIQKMCNRKQNKCKDLFIYPKGSMGPKAADELIESDGFEWFYSLSK